MNLFFGFLLILVSAASQKTFAYTAKEGNVSAILGPFFHKTNFEDKSHGVESPVQGGYGLIANGDVSDTGALEIAMFMMPKIFMQEQNGNYVTEQTRLIHITMGYKRWFNEHFAVTAAFFSSYSMGDPEIIHSDFAPGLEPTTSAKDTTEYGFDIGAYTELWERDNLAIVLDGRYSRSLTNKSGESADHYGVLVGIRYFIQNKQGENKPTPPGTSP